MKTLSERASAFLNAGADLAKGAAEAVTDTTREVFGSVMPPAWRPVADAPSDRYVLLRTYLGGAYGTHHVIKAKLSEDGRWLDIFGAEVAHDSNSTWTEEPK
jgi:hypothetical protein